MKQSVINTIGHCDIHFLVLFLLFFLSSCGSTPEMAAALPEKQADWSSNRVVHSNHSMITLLHPSDLAHHQAEPANWYLFKRFSMAL